MVSITQQNNIKNGDFHTPGRWNAKMRIKIGNASNNVEANDIKKCLDLINEQLIIPSGLHIAKTTFYLTLFCERDYATSLVSGDQSLSVEFYNDFEKGEIVPNFDEAVWGNRIDIRNIIQDNILTPNFEERDDGNTNDEITESEEVLKNMISGAEIRKRRTSIGLTIRKLSELSGISGDVLCKYENGQWAFTEEEEQAVIQAINEYQNNPSDLFTEKDLDEILYILDINRRISHSEYNHIKKWVLIGFCNSIINEANLICINRTDHTSIPYINAILMRKAEKGIFA